MSAPAAGDAEHRADKRALFLLATLVVVVLGGIVAGVFIRSQVPDKGDVLLGSIVTGLILFLRDLVNAVRTSWEEVTRGKITDQLASSGPPAPPPPKDAAEAAGTVAAAAGDAADEIGRQAAGNGPPARETDN